MSRTSKELIRLKSVTHTSITYGCTTASRVLLKVEVMLECSLCSRTYPLSYLTLYTYIYSYIYILDHHHIRSSDIAIDHI